MSYKKWYNTYKAELLLVFNMNTGIKMKLNKWLKSMYIEYTKE